MELLKSNNDDDVNEKRRKKKELNKTNISKYNNGRQ